MCTKIDILEENNAFCDHCGRNVAFSVSDKIIVGSIMNEKVVYNGYEACCRNCKRPVYVPEVADLDVTLLYATYKITHPQPDTYLDEEMQMTRDMIRRKKDARE